MSKVLWTGLPARNQQGVIELLTTRPELLENLQKGIQGEYDIILSLVSILDQGVLEKDLVDMVVNSCASPTCWFARRRVPDAKLGCAQATTWCVGPRMLPASCATRSLSSDHSIAQINLRDDILEHRVRFAVIAMDEEQKNRHLRSALAGLERYFFLIAFASYCNEPPMSFRDTFSPWLKVRRQVCNPVVGRASDGELDSPLHRRGQRSGT